MPRQKRRKLKIITAIIVAAGKGERMKDKDNKAFLPLAGQPMLLHSYLAFERSKVDNIVVVAQPAEVNRVVDLLHEYEQKKLMAVAPGGDQRQDSVANALALIGEETKLIAIHDAARQLVTTELINKIIEDMGEADGIIPGVIPVDTIKQTSGDFIVNTPKRDNLRAAQTPQIFKKSALLKAYEKAKNENFYGTDDASLLEKYGYKVKATNGSYDNIKVTTPIDLALAQIILSPGGGGEG